MQLGQDEALLLASVFPSEQWVESPWLPLPSWEKPRGAEAGEHAERDPGRAPDSTGRLGGSSGVPVGRLIHTTEGGQRALLASAGALCCQCRLLLPGQGVKIN